MSRQNPGVPPPHPPGGDPRVEELLQRVEALERRLAMMPGARGELDHGLPNVPARGLATPAAPRTAPPAAPAIAPSTSDFLQRLAAFKHDKREARMSEAEVTAGAAATVAGDVDLSGTREMAAIGVEAVEPVAAGVPPIAPSLAPPVAPPIALPVGSAFSPPRTPAVAPPVAPVFVPAPTGRSGRAPKPKMGLESLIGGKFFAAAGAIVVVIGVVMFFKLALDRGWFSMPPAFRCLAAAGFGALLLGAGEWARRKINAVASAGLSAAGIATMYGAAWAAYGFFHIVDAPLGFLLLAAAAAIGIVVALRAGLVSVAIVSLLGAYLAPLIASAQQPSALVMPAYLFALLVLGLALSARRPRPFRALRGVVWWGTVLLGTVSVFYAAGQGQALIGIGFLALVWAAVHAELWYGARKAPEAVGEVAPGGVSWRAARPVLSTFATTMWAAGIGVWSLSNASGGVAPPDWWVTGAFAVGAGVVAMILAGNLRVLVDIPENDGERLGTALMAQAGALFMATVALGLGGQAQVLAWVFIGVAAVFAGRWVKSRAMDVYGLIVLGVAVARLVVYDSWASGVTGPGTVGDAFLGLSITEWTLLMCGAAAGWGAAGVLLLRSQAQGKWRSLGVTSIGIGLAVGFGSFLSPHAQPTSVLTLLMLVALAALGIGRLLRSRGMDIYAMAILALAVADLLIVEMPPFRDLSPVHPGLMILGLSLTKWTALMLGAATAWAVVGITFVRSEQTDGVWRRTGIACIAISMCVAFGAFVSPVAALGSIAWLWLTMSVAIFIAHRFFPRLALDLLAFLGLASAAAVWAMAYTRGNWSDYTNPVGLHPGLVQALALAAAFWGGAGVLWNRIGRHGGPTAPEALRYAVAMAVGLIFISTSLEVRRAAGVWVEAGRGQKAALSIWWGVFGLVLIVAGFWRRVPVVRHTGLALMTIAIGKVILVDLRDVSQGWRVASFLGLGLMMLGVAVGYAKAHANWERGERDEDEGECASAQEEDGEGRSVEHPSPLPGRGDQRERGE